ncbi:MAG: tetratricopeptide repeat protein [Acidobacteriota bacterium]
MVTEKVRDNGVKSPPGGSRPDARLRLIGRLMPSRGQRPVRDLLLWLLALVLLAGTFWAYHETLGFPFLNLDDPQYVTKNSRVQAGLSLDNLKWALTTGYFSNWHPLVWLSYMIDVELFGLNPAGFHAVNLLFHLANTAALFLVLFAATGERFATFLVAGLFALHPLHCESVTWIAERKDLLSTFFGLLALGAYVRYCRNKTAGRWLNVTVLLALGLMSKPMLVTWPFVFLLFDYWPMRRLTFPVSLRAVRPLVLEKVVWLAMAAAVSVVSLAVQHQVSRASLPALLRLENAFVAYTRYLGKTFLPRNLAVFYPHPGFGLSILDLLPAVVVVGSITLIAVLAVRTRPYLAAGWFWYLGTLLPVIGLVQIGYQGMADRYTYIPSIGLFLSLVWLGRDLVSGSRRASLAFASTFLLVVLPALAWVTVRQNRYWSDSRSLFEHAIETTENNFFAHNNLGATLGEEGNLKAAAFHFRRSLEIKPDYPEALHNQGRMLQLQGKAAEAIAYLRAAVKEDWLNARFHCTLGHALFSLGRMDEAFSHYTQAMKMDPQDRDARYGRGRYYLARSQFAMAAAEYQKLLEENPGDSGALMNLGAARALQGQFSEAARVFDLAVQLDPLNPAAHRNRGQLYEDCGQLDRAAASYREALRLAPNSAEIREALARVEKRKR